MIHVEILISIYMCSDMPKGILRWRPQAESILETIRVFSKKELVLNLAELILKSSHVHQ